MKKYFTRGLVVTFIIATVFAFGILIPQTQVQAQVTTTPAQYIIWMYSEGLVTQTQAAQMLGALATVQASVVNYITIPEPGSADSPVYTTPAEYIIWMYSSGIINQAQANQLLAILLATQATVVSTVTSVAPATTTATVSNATTTVTVTVPAPATPSTNPVITLGQTASGAVIPCGKTAVNLGWTSSAGSVFYNVRVDDQTNGWTFAWDGLSSHQCTAGSPGDLCWNGFVGLSLPADYFKVQAGHSYHFWVDASNYTSRSMYFSAAKCEEDAVPAAVPAGSGVISNDTNHNEDAGISASAIPSPTNLTLTCPAPGTSATLNWTAPAGYSNFNWRINIAPPGGPMNPFLNGGNNLAATSKSAPTTPGQSYIAWVHTYSNGVESVPAVSNTVTCPLPPTTANVTLGSTSNGTVLPCTVRNVTLGWSAVSGESNYNLRVDDQTANGWNGKCSATDPSYPEDLCWNGYAGTYLPTNYYSVQSGHTYNFWVDAPKTGTPQNMSFSVASCPTSSADDSQNYAAAVSGWEKFINVLTFWK
jgi:hypothetical protein